MLPFCRPLLLTLGLVLLVPPSRPAAQGGPELRLVVAPGAQARSSPVRLSAGEGWQIRLQAQPQQPQPYVGIYVHSQGGELVGRDDPDAISDAYTWRAETDGTFYFVVQNSGAGPGTVIATRVARPAPEPGRSTARPVPAGNRNYAVTRVFFATDRQPAAPGAATFSGEFSNGLRYGYSDVSIPRDHRLGELEGPSIFRLEFRSDPERHIVLLRVQTASAADFSRAFSSRVAASLRHEALLFVHGFNVTFDEAMRRAAQVSYDLAFGGPTLVFSWPSQGSMLPVDYRRDERNAELSADHLRSVMLDVMKGSPGLTLHVIAHSMGNRVLASALEQIAAGGAVSSKLDQVAMVAPDIDAELFRRASPKFAGAARRLTLYASSADAALKVSQNLAGYSRAGQGGADVLVIPGIDTIDASSVDTSTLGFSHSYYADNSTVLSDLFGLLRGRPPSERFGLVSVTTSRGPYWRFQPAAR
jgi:esterase/lipase superfamily enzyme